MHHSEAGGRPRKVGKKPFPETAQGLMEDMMLGLFRWPASRAQILALGHCGYEHLRGLMVGVLPGTIGL